MAALTYTIDKVNKTITVSTDTPGNYVLLIIWDGNWIIVPNYTLNIDGTYTYTYPVFSDGYYKFIAIPIEYQSDTSPAIPYDYSGLADGTIFAYVDKGKVYKIVQDSGINTLLEMPSLSLLLEEVIETDPIHINFDVNAEELIVNSFMNYIDNVNCHTKYDDTNEKRLSQARAEFSMGNIKNYYKHLTAIANGNRSI